MVTINTSNGRTSVTSFPLIFFCWFIWLCLFFVLFFYFSKTLVHIIIPLKHMRCIHTMLTLLWFWFIGGKAFLGLIWAVCVLTSVESVIPETKHFIQYCCEEQVGKNQLYKVLLYVQRLHFVCLLYHVFNKN